PTSGAATFNYPGAFNTSSATTYPLVVNGKNAAGISQGLQLTNISAGNNGGVTLDFSTYSNGTQAPAARIEAIDKNSFGADIVFLTKATGGNNNSLTEQMRILCSSGSNGTVQLGSSTTLKLQGTISA